LVGYRDIFFRIFKNATVHAPGEIELAINNFESIGFYIGSPAEF